MKLQRSASVVLVPLLVVVLGGFKGSASEEAIRTCREQVALRQSSTSEYEFSNVEFLTVESSEASLHEAYKTAQKLRADVLRYKAALDDPRLADARENNVQAFRNTFVRGIEAAEVLIPLLEDPYILYRSKPYATVAFSLRRNGIEVPVGSGTCRWTASDGASVIMLDVRNRK